MTVEFFHRLYSVFFSLKFSSSFFSCKFWPISTKFQAIHSYKIFFSLDQWINFHHFYSKKKNFLIYFYHKNVEENYRVFSFFFNVTIPTIYTSGWAFHFRFAGCRGYLNMGQCFGKAKQPACRLPAGLPNLPYGWLKDKK